MKALAMSIGVGLLSLAVSGAALAQCCGTTSGYDHRPHYGGVPLVHRHASTAAEGYARGFAAMLYAQGVYNRLNAEARIAHAQAYALELENRQRRVDTFFNLRATNGRARAAERGDRPTFEELAKMAQESAPPRLGQAELDPNSGRIHWPVALMADTYADYRAQLEQIFSYRAATGTIGGEQRQAVEHLTGAMLADLKGDIRQISPMEYSRARGFLHSLAYEARLPVA